jgi:hypothetical protein
MSMANEQWHRDRRSGCRVGGARRQALAALRSFQPQPQVAAHLDRAQVPPGTGLAMAEGALLRRLQ